MADIQIDNDFDLDFLDNTSEEERPVNVRSYVKESSFNSVGTKDLKKPTGRSLILREEHIDRFSIKRTRVLLTPSMCQMPHCKYDAASKWGGWQFVPESEKTVVLDVLKKHKEYHTINEELIVDEDLLDGSWLQSPKGI